MLLYFRQCLIVESKDQEKNQLKKANEKNLRN